MLSGLSFRSVRSLSAALAVAALLTTLALPVQAAPRDESRANDPMAALVSWVLELLRPVSLPDANPAPAPAPDQAYEKTGQCMDPNGQPSQCPEPD